MSGADLVHGVQLVAIAAAFFSVAFVLHVVIWRLSAARPSGGALVVLLAAAVVVQCLAASVLLATPGPETILAGALALEFAACYAISYPAMQADSPSLRIARELAAAGGRGLAREELYRLLDEASLVRERIDDLLRDGLATEHEGRLACTRRGVVLARIFAFWKALLREPKGG